MKKLYAIIALSVFSIANAIYLAIAAFWVKAQKEVSLFCDVSETISCANLFNYDFAWLFWIPFPMIAIPVYSIIIILTLLAIFNKIKFHFKALIAMSLWWISFNAYIIYNEFIVWVFCLACLACALSILSIWIISIFGLKEQKKS